MAMWTEEKRPDMQDIPSRMEKAEQRATIDQIPEQLTPEDLIKDKRETCFG